MSYNIPVNLMNTATPPAVAQPAVDGISGINTQTAVQPALATTDSQGAASDHSTGGQASTQQQALTYKRSAATSASLNTAEPQSVVSAQSATAPDEAPPLPEHSAAIGKALADGLAATKPDADSQTERVAKLDRYAPPDPLPTASILKDKPITPIKPTDV